MTATATPIGARAPSLSATVANLIPLRQWQHSRRGGYGYRCALHQHEVRRREIPRVPIGHNPHHHMIGMADPYASLVTQREWQGMPIPFGMAGRKWGVSDMAGREGIAENTEFRSDREPRQNADPPSTRCSRRSAGPSPSMVPRRRQPRRSRKAGVDPASMQPCGTVYWFEE
jgi:hypothetical protein